MAQENMTYAGHARSIWRLGLPLIGGHMAGMLVGMTDTLMLGWYSVDALAAVVLASTLFFVIFIMGSGFAFGLMPMVAEAHAQDDEVAIRRVTRMGMWLSIIYSLLMLPLLWFSGPVLVAIGQDPDLAASAQVYLRVMGIGLIPAILIMVFKSYLAALEHTRVVFWVTVAAAATNAAVNYVLIFGRFGFPELGVLGAATASLSVHVVSIIGVAAYAVVKLPEHTLFSRFWKPDWEAFAKVFRIGLPIGFTQLAEVGLFAVSAMMMGWIGKVPLAAHGIVINLAGMAFMMHLGLSNAATIRAGNAIGRRDADHLARGAKTGLVISMALAVCAIAVFLAIPEVLISAFLDREDPQFELILQTGVGLLFFAALFQFVDGAQAMALGFLRGIQDTKVPMVYAALSYWGCGLGTGYVLAFVLDWGAQGIWIGLVVGLTVAAITLMWRFWAGLMPKLRAEFAEPDVT